MESRFDAEDLMAQNNKFNNNLTDFKHELLQRQPDEQGPLFAVSPVENNQIQDDDKKPNVTAHNQVCEGNGTEYIQTQLKGEVSEQSDACDSSSFSGVYFVEDRTPDNLIQDENSMNNFKDQISHGDRMEFHQLNSCSKVQNSAIDLSTSGTLKEGGIPADQNDGSDKCVIQEQQRIDDNFIPLCNDEKKTPADERKIYVGEISDDTYKHNLLEHFNKFGEVMHVKIKRKITFSKPRNFAFITFAHKSSVDSVMRFDNHVIDGKKVTVGRRIGKQFAPKPRTTELKKSKFIRMKSKRIFVGGINPATTGAEILKYFKVFGKVKKIDHPFDKKTNQRKNFWVVTFKSEDSADRVCEKFIHVIGGQKCMVKRDHQSLREFITDGKGNGQFELKFNGSSGSTVERGRTTSSKLIPRQTKRCNIFPAKCILS